MLRDENSHPIDPQVSALEFVRVRKMFREMVSKIRSNQSLWWAADRGDDEPVGEENGEKCTVQ